MWPFDICILFPALFKFLTHDVPGLFFSFPASGINQKTISPGSSGSCFWSILLRNQDLVVRCAHYNGLPPSFSLLVASLTLRNTALISHNICTYTYANIHICFRITNLCTCKKRFTEDSLICVWLFVFAFSFTGKILFCKVIYISSSLPQVLHAWYIIYL